MNTHADKTQENKSQSVASVVSQMQSSGESTFQFVDNRPEAVAKRELQEMANNSPRAKQASHLQAMADKNNAKQQPIQNVENNTGLPENLKSGIESLSGYSMNDVKVHYNSEKPTQLHAHAYAQGTDMHLGPGQDKHLPHEAWHVVQQKQGRVKPTVQLNGEPVNNELALEQEAEKKGVEAEYFSQTKQKESLKTSPPILRVKQLVGDINIDVGNIDHNDTDDYALGIHNIPQEEGPALPIVGVNFKESTFTVQVTITNTANDARTLRWGLRQYVMQDDVIVRYVDNPADPQQSAQIEYEGSQTPRLDGDEDFYSDDCSHEAEIGAHQNAVGNFTLVDRPTKGIPYRHPDHPELVFGGVWGILVFVVKLVVFEEGQPPTGQDLFEWSINLHNGDVEFSIIEEDQD